MPKALRNSGLRLETSHPFTIYPLALFLVVPIRRSGGCQDSCRLFGLSGFAQKVLFGGPFLLWIESYYFNRFPVASLSGPAVWVLLSRLIVDLFSFVQDCLFPSIVPIIRCHKADLAVKVICVVPFHKAINPALCLLLAGKRLRRVSRPILQ